VATRKERSEFGRRLASLRKKVELACPQCGKAVRGNKTRRYCSLACRQRAYRERRDAKAGE
jgi:hypothetical protein